MRFKCKISILDFKQRDCIKVLAIENVEEVNFRECCDCPMVEIKYYQLNGKLSYKIIPSRGIECIEMEEQ